MSGTLFDPSILSYGCDFSRKHMIIAKNGSISAKNKPKIVLLPKISQNSDLYKTYQKVSALTEEQILELENLDKKSLSNAYRYIEYLSHKISKSKKPHCLKGLIVRIYNCIARWFSFKKIEIYEYNQKEKVVELKKRIGKVITASQGIASKSFSSTTAATPKTSSVGSPPSSLTTPKTTSSSSSSSSSYFSTVSSSLVAPKGSPSVSSPSSATSTPPKIAFSSSSSSSSLGLLPASSSSNSSSLAIYIDYDEEAKELEKLKKEKKWGDLFNRLKSCYQDDAGEEVARLEKAGILTKAIYEQLEKSVYSLEAQKHNQETKNNTEMVKAAIGRALEIKKWLKDDFFVMISAQAVIWNLINYLNKELVRHKYSIKETTHFKFVRMPGKDKDNISIYRDNPNFNDDGPVGREAVISCDAYFFSTSAYESFMHFLVNASNIHSDPKNVIAIAERNIRQVFPGENELCGKLINAFKTAIEEIKTVAPVATLHVICVPKDRSLKGSEAYLYRSHAFGKKCICWDLQNAGEKVILDKLQAEDCFLKCSAATGFGKAPQYRLVAKNLDLKFDFIKFINPIDSHDGAVRHQIKNRFRAILDGAGHKALKRPVGSSSAFPKKKLPPMKAPLVPRELIAVKNEDSFSVSRYFQKSDKMNTQTTTLDLRTNILIGPDTPGFMDKFPMPFCAVSLMPTKEVILKSETQVFEDSKGKRISIKHFEEDPFYIDVSGYPALKIGDKIKLFDYDSEKKFTQIVCEKTKRAVRGLDGKVREKGLEPNFTAFLSKCGVITLDKSGKEKFNIHEEATHFRFIKPVEALGNWLRFEAIGELKVNSSVLTEEMIKVKIGDYTKSIIGFLIETYGEEFAALMYIGGYAYYKKDQLIQLKALVGNVTPDVLPVKKAQKSQGCVPKDLLDEFNESVRCITHTNSLKDGNCTQVTSPELMGYGALYFDWIPPGYIPASAKAKIDCGNTVLNQEYITFWKEKGGGGLFIYKFNDPSHDCFLAIGEDSDKESALAGSAGNIAIMKNGKPEAVSALVTPTCIVGPCRNGGKLPNKPNVVWVTKHPTTGEEKYRLVACSDCNKAINEIIRKRFYRQPVVSQYDLSCKLEELQQQISYKSIYLKVIASYKDANIAEMCSSIRVPTAGMPGAPSKAAFVEFLYPVEKLTSTTTQLQLKSLYAVGGYAFYDNSTQLVGISELAFAQEGSLAELQFEGLCEEKNIPESVKETFKEAIKKGELPFVTIKEIRALGVSFFMWIPPNDKHLSTPKGMFLYCSSDGSTFFSKRVK